MKKNSLPIILGSLIILGVIGAFIPVPRSLTPTKQSSPKNLSDKDKEVTTKQSTNEKRHENNERTVEGNGESSCSNPSQDNAFPFVPTPKCFEEYLQSVNWGSGRDVVFTDLSNCKAVVEDANGGTNTWHLVYDGDYYCTDGFVTISDPRGTQVCKVYAGDQMKPGVVYKPYKLLGSYERKETVQYWKDECVWKS